MCKWFRDNALAISHLHNKLDRRYVHNDLDLDEKAWKSQVWRQNIPTVFRPINLPTSVLIRFYNLPYNISDYQPFSAHLSYWYAKLFKPVGIHKCDHPEAPRAKPVVGHYNGSPGASRLVCEVVPHLEDQIERFQIKRSKEMQRIKDVQHIQAIVAGELTELQ